MRKLPFMQYPKLLNQNLSRWSLRSNLVVYITLSLWPHKVPVTSVPVALLSFHPLRQNMLKYQYHSLTLIKTIQFSCTLSLLIFNQVNWFTGDGQNITSTGDKWNNEQHVTESLLRKVCRVCEWNRVFKNEKWSKVLYKNWKYSSKSYWQKFWKILVLENKLVHVVSQQA